MRLHAVVLGLSVCAALAASVPDARAQEAYYKGKRLTIVINFGAGGPADVEGRLTRVHVLEVDECGRRVGADTVEQEDVLGRQIPVDEAGRRGPVGGHGHGAAPGRRALPRSRARGRRVGEDQRRAGRSPRPGRQDQAMTYTPVAPIVTARLNAHDDAHSLRRAVSTGAYTALRTALQQTPEEVHETVKTAVLQGRGDGTFLPEVEIPVVAGSRTLIASDVDGDGRMDLVAAGLGAQPWLAVALNRSK